MSGPWGRYDRHQLQGRVPVRASSSVRAARRGRRGATRWRWIPPGPPPRFSHAATIVSPLLQARPFVSIARGHGSGGSGSARLSPGYRRLLASPTRCLSAAQPSLTAVRAAGWPHRHGCCTRGRSMLPRRHSHSRHPSSPAQAMPTAPNGRRGTAAGTADPHMPAGKRHPGGPKGGGRLRHALLTRHARRRATAAGKAAAQPPMRHAAARPRTCDAPAHPLRHRARAWQGRPC